MAETVVGGGDVEGVSGFTSRLFLAVSVFRYMTLAA
jgi:hypothetical protein